MPIVRTVVLVSGNGTTLQNLIDRINEGRLPAQIVRVISNQPNAFALKRARQANIPAEAIIRRDFDSTEEFSRAIFQRCRDSQADLVCMAGFLQLLEIPEDFRHRVMNIHPALLPSFGGQGMYGRHVHQAVLDAGAKISGCTVHFADHEYDRGPIILQRAVPVLDDDTPESLAQRVHEEENEAYPQAITWFAEGRLHVDGRHVRLQE